MVGWAACDFLENPDFSVDAQLRRVVHSAATPTDKGEEGLEARAGATGSLSPPSICASPPMPPQSKKPSPNPLTARRADAPLSFIGTQTIYCGDNLDQLRRFPPKCVDLVYIDPPFNSNRNYEVFWEDKGESRAFRDRHASTKAYVDYMRPRCVELHRVLKKTGSFYYHCDWHASHYVKVMLDQIFGENNFRNEVIWKRASTVKGNAGQGSRRWGPNTDSLFFYTASDRYAFNPLYRPYSDAYLKKFYKFTEPGTGKRYRLISMIGPGGAAKGNPYYAVMGVARYWRYSEEKMRDLIRRGMVVQTSPGAVPQRKLYLDEGKGVAVQTLWDDIESLGASSRELMGYPTQKPVALLERVIKASSDPDDIVLDAFCGCGTALVAAERLGRRWIGIDISPTACRVMADRLKRDCKLTEGADFFVRDMPRDERQLREMPHDEFQNWAVNALGGIPNKTKTGDMGIDGKVFPAGAPPKSEAGELSFMDHWYPVQVKQKDRVHRPDIDSFEAVMMRENRQKGFFVAFDFSEGALTEIRAFYQRSKKAIVPLTVREILDEEKVALEMKLA